MKRKIWNVWNQKCVRFMLLAFMLLSILPVQKVEAASWNGILGNNFKITLVCDKIDCTYLLQEPSALLKNVKITLSNRSVATVKNMPKKEGTTKVTITGTANGKKIKLTGTVKVVSVENPFTILKLDGKNYLSKVQKQYNYVNVRTNKEGVKLQYKLKPGWKLQKSNGSIAVSAMVYNIREGKYYEPVSSLSYTDVIKNGKTYPVPKGEKVDMSIALFCENKSKGITEMIRFTINP